MTIPPAAAAVLREWLPPNDDPTRPLMQLATVDADGTPDVRSVLLSAWDSGGFLFHTDARSRKAADIAGRPRVALALAMPEAGRQVTVQGGAEPAGAEADREAYDRRTPYLRRLAWFNTAELAQAERQERRAVWARSVGEQPDTALAVPPTWVGYLVRPTRITMWEADPAGPSHRIEYRLAGEAWRDEHLPG